MQEAVKQNGASHGRSKIFIVRPIGSVKSQDHIWIWAIIGFSCDCYQAVLDIRLQRAALNHASQVSGWRQQDHPRACVFVQGTIDINAKVLRKRYFPVDNLLRDP